MQRRQPIGEGFLVDPLQRQESITEGQQNIKDGAEISQANHPEEPGGDLGILGRGAGVAFLGERPYHVDVVAVEKEPAGEDGSYDIQALPGGEIER